MVDRATRLLAAPFQRGLRRPHLITVLRATPVVGAAAFAIYEISLTFRDPSWDGFLIDWRTYANAVERFLAGQSLYAPAQLQGPYQLPRVVLIGYGYPPPSVIFFIPFASVPLGVVAWLTLNVGLLVTGLLAIARFELGRTSMTAMTLILLALATYQPVFVGIGVANVNIGMAGLLAWTYVAGRTFRLLPAIAAAGAIVKLVPGALIFWSDRRRFLRNIVIAIAVAASVIAVTMPVIGVAEWQRFATALNNSQPFCGPTITPTLACVLQPAIGISAAKLLPLAVAVVLGLAAVVARSSIVALWLVVGAWIAPVTDFHDHTWTIVMVPAVATIARAAATIECRFRRRDSV